MNDRPSDIVWRRDEIESPCVKVCILQPETRICLGCFRTGDEIAAWSRLSPEARSAIMAELPERAKKLPGRRGGRAGHLARGN